MTLSEKIKIKVKAEEVNELVEYLENNEEAGEHWTPRDAVRLMGIQIVKA